MRHNVDIPLASPGNVAGRLREGQQLRAVGGNLLTVTSDAAHCRIAVRATEGGVSGENGHSGLPRRHSSGSPSVTMQGRAAVLAVRAFIISLQGRLKAVRGPIEGGRGQSDAMMTMRAAEVFSKPTTFGVLV